MTDGSGNGYLGRGRIRCWFRYTDNELRRFIRDWERAEDKHPGDFQIYIDDAINELAYRSMDHNYVWVSSEG